MPRGKAEFKTQKPVETEADVSVSPVVDASSRHVPSMREMNPSGSYETLLDVLVDRTEVSIAAKELEEDIITEPNYYRDLEVKELDDDLLVEKGLSFMEEMEVKNPIERLAGTAIRAEFRAEKLKKVKNSVFGYEQPEPQERPKELRPRAGDLEVKELDESMAVGKGFGVEEKGPVLGAAWQGAKALGRGAKWGVRKISGAGKPKGQTGIVKPGTVGDRSLQKVKNRRAEDRTVDDLFREHNPRAAKTKDKMAYDWAKRKFVSGNRPMVNEALGRGKKSVDDDILIFKGDSFLDQVEEKGMNIGRKIDTQQRRTQNKVNNIAKPTPPKPPSIKRPTPNKPTTPTVTKPAPPAGVKTRGAARFVVGKGVETRVVEALSGAARGAVSGGIIGGTSAATASDKDRAASFVRGLLAGATAGAVTGGAIGAARPELYEMAVHGGMIKRTAADTIENAVPLMAAAGAGVKSSSQRKNVLVVREESPQTKAKELDDEMVVCKGESFLGQVETKYTSAVSGARNVANKARNIVSSLPKGRTRGGPSIPKPKPPTQKEILNRRFEPISDYTPATPRPTGKRPGATATKDNPAGAGTPTTPVADANKSQAIVNQEKRMAAENTLSQSKTQQKEAQTTLDELVKQEKIASGEAKPPMSKWTKRLIGAGVVGGAGLTYAATRPSTPRPQSPQYYTRGFNRSLIIKSFKGDKDE